MTIQLSTDPLDSWAEKPVIYHTLNSHKCIGVIGGSLAHRVLIIHATSLVRNCIKSYKSCTLYVWTWKVCITTTIL